MRKENTVACVSCDGVFFELERSPTRAGQKSNAHMPKCTSGNEPGNARILRGILFITTSSSSCSARDFQPRGNRGFL